ncbi:complex I NDUFA9 subunit family protein [Lutibaculum baratangense]|uniref:NAD-dependent epimerase/dehydratase n=1 Tax=Lutibaculum baratangense AMV1 TaxID=631454 RepID=V4RII4_9HYPH|nr:complex I NDUFA9 subunit family protein [Lutibaculum baratangense]ESR25896.1 NAD-dependent epimerase/dehydratase [Lutibaculum baratangense AMV1]
MAGRNMRYELVTVFGGSGFIGRYVVRALAVRGYRVRVAVRRPELAGFMKPYGSVGQIQAIQTNLRFEDSVRRAVQGSDAVVNLVGILAEGGRQSFSKVHAEGAGLIARAAAEEGITRLTAVSAIGADEQSESHYARTKAAGEAAIRDAVPGAVILRPSIMFGQEDQFFNRFAAMARMSPFLPLIGGGQTRFQPVFVGDVGEAVARAVDGKATPGCTYELGGPEIRTFRQLMELMLHVIGRKRVLLNVPFGAADRLAGVLGALPGRLLTTDQVIQLRHDNVVSQAAIEEGRTIEALGIDPVGMEAILPTYLQRFRRAGQFTNNVDTPRLQP